LNLRLQPSKIVMAAIVAQLSGSARRRQSHAISTSQIVMTGLVPVMTIKGVERPADQPSRISTTSFDAGA
jgi:hypothetical protein